MNFVKKLKYNYYKRKFKKKTNSDFEKLMTNFDRRELQACGIEINTYCNLNCIMCETKSMQRAHGEMSWEIFEKTSDEFLKNGFKYFGIHTINEPLMDKKIIERLEYLHPKGMGLGIVTNGMLLDTFLEDIEKKPHLKNFFFIFSIDGSTKETYEKIRRGANFEKLIKNLDKLMEYKRNHFQDLSVAVNYTLSKDNLDELGDFITTFKKYFNSINVSLLNGSNATDNTAYYAKSTLCKGFLAQPCAQPFSNLFVLHNGDITCCCRDYFATDLLVGNIKEISIQEAWKSDKLKSIQDAHIQGKLPHQCLSCYGANYFVAKKIQFLTDMTIKNIILPSELSVKIQKLIKKDDSKSTSMYNRI